MVLTSTYNLCVERKYEKDQSFLSENFQFLEVKFSIYLNRRVFVMSSQLLFFTNFENLIPRMFHMLLSSIRIAVLEKLINGSNHYMARKAILYAN